MALSRCAPPSPSGTAPTAPWPDEIADRYAELGLAMLGYRPHRAAATTAAAPLTAGGPPARVTERTSGAVKGWPVLLGDAVEFGARKFADRPAIIFDDEITTFVGLRDRVNRLSNGLLQLTAPGERVAILPENWPQFVEAYAGVPMAGMA